jgi:hypothetical protein
MKHGGTLVKRGFRFGDRYRPSAGARMLRAMRNDRLLAALAIFAGIVLLVLAIVYWVEPARSLPGFFPGHEAGSSHHHVKHGIAAFVLAIACFVFAWFRTGPKRSTTAVP